MLVTVFPFLPLLVYFVTSGRSTECMAMAYGLTCANTKVVIGRLLDWAFPAGGIFKTI